jgi:hypothetical protein
MTRRHSTMAAALAALAVLAQTAAAGSQLLCRRYEIGSEPSLPWTSSGDWGQPRADYPREALVADTLKLLTPDRPVLVRMETLRRAATYTQKRPDLARDLLGRLTARVLEAESAKASSASAWFDAGYFVATLQLGRQHAEVTENLDAYRWVARALETQPNADMEFAAALIRFESPSKPGRHLQAAYEGARPGSLLERNLGLAFGERHPPKAAAR